MPTFEVVGPPLAELGEGPIWDPDSQRLHWIDSTRGCVFRAAPDGGNLEMWVLGEPIGSMALRASGGALITLASGIYLFDFDSGERQFVAHPDDGKPARYNDGKVDRQGRFVTGGMDYNLINPDSSWLVGRIEAGCSLILIDKDLSIRTIKEDVGITNGPCFSPDGTTFYLSDSWRDEIQAFDYDIETGSLSNQREFASFRDDKGSTGQAQPDGCTVDDEGYLWSVAVYAGEIRRYAPDGTVDRRVATPTLKPTSVAFGGADMDILFVTTMGNPELPIQLPADGPAAGVTFAIKGLGHRGIPETRFGG